MSDNGLAMPDRARPALPQIPHFYLPGPAQPLTFIDKAWASPASSIPHFYRDALGQPSPQPLTSIGQTDVFYQPLAASWLQTQNFPRTAAPRMSKIDNAKSHGKLV